MIDLTSVNLIEFGDALMQVAPWQSMRVTITDYEPKERVY